MNFVTLKASLTCRKEIIFRDRTRTKAHIFKKNEKNYYRAYLIKKFVPPSDLQLFNKTLSNGV